MKLFCRTALLGASILCSNAFGLNPQPGWYGGVILGGSSTKDVSIANNFVVDGIPASLKAQLSYSGSGTIGGMLGYRYSDFRAEVEPFYNNGPYKRLQIDATVAGLSAREVITSQKFNTGRTYLKGSTDVTAVMVNGYFDFFPFVGPQSNFVPYIGGGIGYANIRNKIKLICNGATLDVVNGIVNTGCPASGEVPPPSPRALPAQGSVSKDSIAGQGIIGANYFLDDFSAFALDFRMFSSQTKFPFDSRTQYYSVNFTFYGAINFG